MKMKRVVFLFMAVACSGCVTSISRQYATTPEHSDGMRIVPKNISFSLRRTTLTSGSGKFDPDNADATLKGAWAAPQQEEVALRQFEDAFCCLIKSSQRNSVGRSSECDIRMNIHLQNGWNAWTLLGAFVSGFTWLTIPCWGDDNYTLYVVASDMTERKKVYELTGSVTTFTWLPCILGMPFSDLPATQVNKITKEEWEELARRMIADGFFSQDFNAQSVNMKTKDTKSPYSVASLRYVDSTRTGTLVVKVDDGNFMAARSWALAYIENLAKDKNVALRTGEKRQETTYALRDEKIEEQSLTIVFETY